MRDLICFWQDIFPYKGDWALESSLFLAREMAQAAGKGDLGPKKDEIPGPNRPRNEKYPVNKKIMAQVFLNRRYIGNFMYFWALFLFN